MPDDGDAHASWVRPVMAIGERVAALEASSKAEFANLREDAKVMRSATHEVNGKLQILLIKLAGIENFTSDFKSLSADVRSLMQGQHERHGSWSATARISALIVTVLTTVGIVGGALVTLADYLHKAGTH
jgi:hypothetical protein